jgi:hypothetical protein
MRAVYSSVSLHLNNINPATGFINCIFNGKRINMQLPNSPKTFSLPVKHLFCPVILFLLSLSVSYSQQVVAQHKVKDHIDLGSGQSLEIIQMRGSGQTEEWYVQYYRGKDLESTPRWEYSESIKISEQRILDAKKQDAPAAGNTPSKNTDEKKPEKENDNGPVATNKTNCSFNPPGREVSSTDNFSIELAKRKIYDTYAKNVNGTAVAPLKVGITFISFSTGQSYKNTVTIDAGRGAIRKYDGAPVGATLYPVFSKHITCEQYKDATERTSVEAAYVCFKNKDGNWTCPISGFPKTTALKD